MTVRSRFLVLTALGAAALVAFVLLTTTAGALPTCTDTFTAASGGSWGTAGNWSTAAVPGTGDVACWSTAKTVVVSSGAQVADSVQGGALQITGGSLTLHSTANDSTVGDLSLDGGGSLTAPTTRTLTVTGNFEWGACTPGCGSPALDAAIDQTGSGTFAIDGTGGLGGPDFTGGSITTTRPVSITNGNFESSGSETLTTTSTIDVGTEQLTGVDPGTTFSAAGVASSTGNYGFWDANLVLTGGTTHVAVSSDLEAGTITVQGGVLDDDGAIVRGGSGLDSMTVTGGTVEGQGNVGNLTNVGGTFSPGNASETAGTMNVTGDFVQQAGGTLDERIAGTTDLGTLQVYGSATLAGDLALTDISGYAPGGGEEYVILTAGTTETGTFAALTGPSASEYTASYPTRAVDLAAKQPTTTTTTPTTTTPTGTTPSGTPPPASTPPPPAPALACTTAQIQLFQVVPRGSKVLITGAARSILAGKVVSIVLESTHKTVATATIGQNGAFTATAPLPAGKARTSDATRYEALVGAVHSDALKLARRAYMLGVIRSGTHVKVSGLVTGHFHRGAKVTISLRVSCHAYRKLATVRLTRTGRFSATVAAPTIAQAAIAAYRAGTTVLVGRRSEPTFTLPVPPTTG